jgi:hypothetical protein
VKRVHLIAAWLAIVALLIDGLLPTAVSAAALPDRAAPVALCGATAGDTAPGRAPPTLPAHRCALCAVWAIGLLPSRAQALTARISDGDALAVIVRSTPYSARQTAYAAAQPRAPPEFTS